MDDAKALIAASGLRIIACDDLEEAAEMVRLLVFISCNLFHSSVLFFRSDEVLQNSCLVVAHDLLKSFLFFCSSGCPSFQYC